MGSRRHNLSPDEKRELIAKAQKYLAAGTSPFAVARSLAGEFGVTEKTALTYIDRARKAWANEHSKWTRDEDRAMHYEMTRDLLLRCMSRRVPEMSKGRPVKDKEGNILLYPSPDYKTAHRCIQTMCRIKGSFKDTIEFEYEGNIQKFAEALFNAIEEYPEAHEKAISEAKRLIP